MSLYPHISEYLTKVANFAAMLRKTCLHPALSITPFSSRKDVSLFFINHFMHKLWQIKCPKCIMSINILKHIIYTIHVLTQYWYMKWCSIQCGDWYATVSPKPMHILAVQKWHLCINWLNHGSPLTLYCEGASCHFLWTMFLYTSVLK